jgi:putative transposase
LKFPRSTYYKVINHQKSTREKFNEILDEKILNIYKDSKKRYGATKIHRALDKQGIKVSLKKVQRRMRHLGIYAIVNKKYRPLKSNKCIEQLPNLIKQDFSTKSINEKWCGDITYIYVSKEKWTYLASVMDLYSRKIIGYAYGKTMDTSLVIKAMENAYLNVKETKGIIFHSDLGSQYTSKEFNDLLEVKGIIHSYSNKANPYDNACIESFHSILKKEEVYIRKYKDFNEAKISLFEYIESFYNRKRIHSSLNYLTPQEVEDLCIVSKTFVTVI